jgi:hypothetical protein
MASSYVVVSQNREVQVLGPTTAIPVQKIGISTRPHNVTVEYPIPIQLWPDAGGAELLQTLAAGIEQQISEGLMVGGQYVQTYDDNGLLVDYLDALVRWEDPNHIRPPQETTVLIPLEYFVAAVDPFLGQTGATPADILSKAYDNLARTALL